jgi:hypothetical protein
MKHRGRNPSRMVRKDPEPDGSALKNVKSDENLGKTCFILKIRPEILKFPDCLKKVG